MTEPEIGKHCDEFGDEYGREIDRRTYYPAKFVEAIVEGREVRMVIRSEYGSAGFDPMEDAIVIEDIVAGGARLNNVISPRGAKFILRTIIE